MNNISKNSYFFFLVSFVVTALVAGTPTYAQDKTSEIDKIFSWAKPDTPGCAVAVSQHGKLVVNRAYGSADLERDVALSPNSIFDIGSTRKQFIAAAVLLLVEEKRLSLSDDVHKFFPELPDYGHKITVDHLLTHTSGLRDWTGILPLAGGDADVLTLILRQRSLNFAPGEEWSYSNSGYVLLTELVARTSGMSFSEFARKRLFEPLGMKTTVYREDLLGVIKNRALAYEKAGNGWKLDMLLGKERGRGSGAILSTAADLVIWNNALTSGGLGAFVTEKLQEQATLNNGRKLNYARGLIVSSYRGGPMVSHSGGAAGYSSWQGRLLAHGLSIAVLCNADATSASDLAGRVGDHFLNAAGAATADATRAPATVNEGAGVTGPDLNSKAGLFFSERTGEPLRLSVNNGRLSIVGGSALVSVTTDRFRNPRGNLFFMSQDEFELHFLSQDQFELKSMEGKSTRYRRAQPYAPTPADLQAFAGRYENDEIGSVFQMVPKKDGLMMRFELSPDKALEFRPVDRDTFQLSRVTLRFLRDKDGKVVAFDYSNPVVRNIKFTRLNDRTNRR
jgi:CubicO group peptidase (beta-lactamase class C family)